MDLNKYQLPKKSKITNERQTVMKDFLDRLNSEVKPPYKQMTPARLGMMLRFVSTSDLKIFYGECKYAKNFSAYFWWCFKKVKNDT
jgi:hypothetical protein